MCIKNTHTGEKQMHIQDLYQKINRSEFDYGLLCSCLKDYAQPRNRIQQWLRTGELIRVKKGFYIFGSMVRGSMNVSKEVLANWIYGPSVISLEYALSYHGLIPERVEAMTNITPKRSKQFLTPIGLFLYHHTVLSRYMTGVLRVDFKPEQSFLIASPEKALADKLISLNDKFKDVKKLEIYLNEDLRVDSNQLSLFNRERLMMIKNTYCHINVDCLFSYMETRYA